MGENAVGLGAVPLPRRLHASLGNTHRCLDCGDRVRLQGL